MNIGSQISPRIVIVYLLALPVLSFLIEAGWGATHGLLAGLSFSKNPEFVDAVNQFAKDRGIDLGQNQGDPRSLMNRLSERDRVALQEMTTEYLKKQQVISFGSTFFVSAVTFGLVSFLTGLFTRSWLFVGLILLASFALNNPIRRFAIITDMPFMEKLAVVLLAQLGASYLCAYLGVKLRARTKRGEKKGTF